LLTDDHGRPGFDADLGPLDEIAAGDIDLGAFSSFDAAGIDLDFISSNQVTFDAGMITKTGYPFCWFLLASIVQTRPSIPLSDPVYQGLLYGNLGEKQ
jgi:hypothetical protein